MNQRGKILLFKSALAGKVKNTQFLVNKINVAEDNNYVMKITLLSLHELYRKQNEKCKSIIQLLMPLANDEVMQHLYTNVKNEEFKKYLELAYLSAHLNSNHNTKKKPLKI